jgi:hypothetical protein
LPGRQVSWVVNGDPVPQPEAHIPFAALNQMGSIG